MTTTSEFEPDEKYEKLETYDGELSMERNESTGLEEEFDEDEALEVLTNPMTSQNVIPTAVEQKRENTRGLLAIVFIVGFFFMLTAGFMLAAFNNLSLDVKSKHLQDILLTISGVLSGPLGFVVGFYFRKGEEGEV